MNEIVKEWVFKAEVNFRYLGETRSHLCFRDYKRNSKEINFFYWR